MTNLPIRPGTILASTLTVAAVVLGVLLPRRKLTALLLSASTLAVHAALYWRFTVDDSFITYRFARNWALGLGPIYQAGARVLGFTSFAWTALLAAAVRCGFDIDLAAKVLGLAFAILALPAVALLARRLTGSATAALVAPLALALHPLYAAWACAGMDTPMFAAVLAWAAWALASGRRVLRVLPLDALLFGLAIWVRPDGVLFAGVGLVCVALTPGPLRARAAACLRWAGVLVATAAPLWLWQWSYYGRVLPNTYYAKLIPDSGRIETGLLWVVAFWVYSGFAWLGLLLIGLAREGLEGRTRLFLALASGALFAWVAWAGGDVLSLRFAVHVLPLLSVGLAAGVAALVEVATRLGKPARAPGPLALACALVLAWSVLSLQQDRVALLSRDQFGAAYVVGNARNVEEVNLPLGRWLARNAPAGARLATWDIGAVGYYSRLPILDLYGLTDTTLADMVHRGAPPAERMAYVERLYPELMVTYMSGSGPVLAWMEAGRDWLSTHYAFHSLWSAQTSGYRLALLTRTDVTLPPLEGEPRDSTRGP